MRVRPRSRGDGVNTIEWVQTGWGAKGYDPTAPGQTDVLYEQDSSGQWIIKEADIYLNGENNDWVLVGASNATKWSVQATLIHEGGHAAGLEHPCEMVADGDVPACSSSAAFEDVAMNPIYNPTLVALYNDDQAGICSIYPKGLCGTEICADTQTCTPLGCRLTCGDKFCEFGQSCQSNYCVSTNDASVATGAPLGFPCASSSDCERGLSCLFAVCQGGASKLGDPCKADANCEQGICSQQDYCAAACQTASACSATNATCVQMDAGVGACISAQSNLGTSCMTADDCVGGQCLAQDNSTPVCTRLCDAATAPCSGGWSCTTVDNFDVCVNPERQEGCACRLSRPNDRRPIFGLISLMSMIALGLRRGRY